MERFEIEDIVGQDKNGIVYQAADKVSGKTVALRRFLPFGPTGGGLEPDEIAAYENAAERLAKIEHPALRTIVLGSADPIDGVPFLVTEWVEGEALPVLLAGEAMDPALVIDLLRIAMEVSLLISQSLGEEAVWVETAPESIIVGTQESGRGFTFWISPLKWLGAEFESRKPCSIVALAEKLTGWEKKIVSDQAGHGLGGWLKWLRNNPEASIREALDTLADSTGNEPPAPDEEDLITNVSRSARPKPKQTSSKPGLLIAAAIILPVIAAAVFVFQTKTKGAPVAAIEATKGKVSRAPIAQKAPTSAKEAFEARAQKFKLEAEKRNKSEADAQVNLEKRIATERKIYEENGKILSPQHAELIRTFKKGDPVVIQGLVHSVRASESGKTIYLNFSQSLDRTLTHGMAAQRDFKGEFKLATFEKFIGKTVTLEGKVEPQFKSYYVKITSLDQIK